jgi:DNA primase
MGVAVMLRETHDNTQYKSLAQPFCRRLSQSYPHPLTTAAQSVMRPRPDALDER